MKKILTTLAATAAILMAPASAHAACNVGINETVTTAPPATLAPGQTQGENYSVTACTVTDHVTVEWVHVTDPTRPFMLNPTNRTTVHAETSHGTAMTGSESWTVPTDAAPGQYAIIVRYYAVGGNGPEAQAAVSFFVASPPPPVDVCQNLPGAQTTTPQGMTNDNGNCTTPPVDVCANIAGVQTTVPAGMTVDGAGSCTTPPVDVCPNVDGVQVTVPAGFTLVAGTCTIIATPTGTPTPLHARLAVTKVANVKQTRAGNTIRYTITATNLGPDDALAVKVCDKLPAGTTYVSATGSAYFTNGSVCWNTARLAKGAKTTTKLTLRVGAAYRAHAVTNTACAKGTDTNKACGTAKVKITTTATKPHPAGVTG